MAASHSVSSSNLGTHARPRASAMPDAAALGHAAQAESASALGAAAPLGVVGDAGVAGSAPASDHPLNRPLRQLTWSDPFRWLAAGWHDFTQAPLIGLFYGACFTAMGWALLAVFRFAPAYTLALSAGFLLLGPLLCMGLYHASRALGQGERPTLLGSMLAWRHKGSALAIFGFVLLIIEMLWGRSAMVIFAVSFDGIPAFDGSLSQLLSTDYLPFVATYLAVGAVFAGLIFAISVISIPMIMDQSVDAITAGLGSLRLVVTQPGVMWLWAALLSAVVLLAMLPGFLGLLVAAPVVGHASWHAYKEASTPRT
jgi:uncharacterized membrane protein